LIESVGIIGVGHLASYLVEGLRRANPELRILLSRHLGEKTEALEKEFGAIGVDDNRAVADGTDLVLVTTRPGDAVAACRAASFRPDHVVISTAVGVALESLGPAVEPATAVRAMPLTCSAIGRSPTLLYPDHPDARAFFEQLGTVYVLTQESQLTPASVVAAFYGWVYALFDETIEWTVEAGVPSEVARGLVLETVRGAAEMGLARPQEELAGLLDSLATPGGITRHGLEVLEDREAFEGWIAALEAVLGRLEAKG
jgi:pyrroline-5-carboxylate reductase